MPPSIAFDSKPSVQGGAWLLPLLGERWSLPVLEALGPGALRYNELSRAVPGISMRMLSYTLDKLERAGLVERTAYAVLPPRTEYSLSARGAALRERLAPLLHWAGEQQVEVEARRSRAGGAPALAGDAGRCIVRFTREGVHRQALPQ
jgi:DNA-binding HxlR family transcriptional regulator